MLAEFEVVILLAQFLHLAVKGVEIAIGVTVFVGEKTFLFGGIKANVFILIKFVRIIELLEDFADDLLVACIGGADEVVVGDTQFFDKRLPVTGQFVSVSLHILAGSFGGLLHFLAVLIEAGEKKRLFAQATARPRDHVCDDLLVCMPEMRLAVHIIDGRGDVELFTQGRQVVAKGRATGKAALFYRYLPMNLARNADATFEFFYGDYLGD